MDFLNIVLNQTGREAEVHGGVAKAYLGGALEAGNLQPAHDVEAAWLFQYEGLVDALGYEDTRRTLSSFDLSSRFRHFATSAAGTMDWLVAKRAIAPPIVRGEGGAIPPARPVLLPEAFPWPIGWPLHRRCGHKIARCLPVWMRRNCRFWWSFCICKMIWTAFGTC